MRKNLLSVFILLIFYSWVNAQTFISPDDTLIKFTGSFFNKIYADSIVFKRHSDTFLALPLGTSLANDDNANTNTSITINFKTDATKIDLHFHMQNGNNAWRLYATYYIDKDSIDVLSQKRDDLTNAGDSSFVFSINSPAAGVHEYKIVLPTFSTLRFDGISLTGGSENLTGFELPQKPLYLAYGNSISHGRGQDVSDQTYPWILAERMGWQLANIAVGGSKTSVPMAEMISNEITQPIDYMTILIGYNDLVGYAKDTTYYKQKLTEFIDTVRRGHPETIIFVLGQTYTTTTENSNGEPVDFDDLRKVQKFIVDSLINLGDDKIHFIKTDHLTGDAELNDVVHLNIDGAYKLGNALADTIAQILSPATGLNLPDTSHNELKIYPNPAHEYIWVDFQNRNIDAVRIYNINGKLISYRKNIEKKNKLRINISKLKNGTYILQTTDNKKIFIKQ